MNPLLELDYLVMTIPEKPTSRNQRYQTTQAGIELGAPLELLERGAEDHLPRSEPTQPEVKLQLGGLQ